MTKILRVPVNTNSEDEAKDTFLRYIEVRGYDLVSQPEFQHSLDEEEITVVAKVQSTYETK